LKTTILFKIDRHCCYFILICVILFFYCIVFYCFFFYFKNNNFIRIYLMWLDLVAFVIVYQDRPLKYLIILNHLMIYQDWLPLHRFSQMRWLHHLFLIYQLVQPEIFIKNFIYIFIYIYILLPYVDMFLCIQAYQN
jgi:hypothetical protein